MDRAWRAIDHRVANSWTQLSDQTAAATVLIKEPILLILVSNPSLDVIRVILESRKGG